MLPLWSQLLSSPRLGVCVGVLLHPILLVLQEGLTPADVALFRDVAKELGVSLETPSSRSRRDHIDAYYGLITFCHAHAWRDDPSFTDEVREQTLVEMERKMLQLMQRNGC